MRITFTFTDSPDLSAHSKDDIFSTYFELPDEAYLLTDLKERVLSIANMVGNLTSAALHITCKELDLHNHPIKLEVETENQVALYINTYTMIFHFTRRPRRLTQHRQLKILKPRTPLILPAYLRQHGKRKRDRHILSKNLIGTAYVTHLVNQTDDGQEYGDIIAKLADQLLFLLNTEPADAPIKQWICEGFHPYWRDGKLADRFNKRSKKATDEERKRQKLAEKLKQRLAASESSSSPIPVQTTGSGRRPSAVPGIFKGVQFRSQLEIRFATELESRGIRWVYESERLSEGNYLVDFYLPDLKTWVEVKGRFEPRDDYLLKEVAAFLKQERSERLFVYTQNKCFAVHSTRFTEIKRSNFWDRLLASR